MASDSIPTFQKFVLRGNSEAIKQFLTQLTATLPPAHWQRDSESEAKAQDASMDGTYYCYQFAGDENDDLPAATLWLFVETGEAQVVNIVAPSLFELGYQRYNAILSRFAEEAKKVLSASGAAVVVQSWREPTLEDILEEEPAQLFKKFARLANSATGTMHPADKERWQDFLISAHLHDVYPDTSLLGSWLQTECHWSEEITDQTLDELHNGLDLLKRYDQSQSV